MDGTGLGVMRAVPHATLAARQRAMQGWMGAQGVDALVVFGQGSAPGMASRSHGNLRFLADWDAEAAPSALVLMSEGAPHLVVGNVFARMMAEQSEEFASTRLGKGAAFAQGVLDLLGGARMVALAGRDEIPLGIWEPLAAAGAASWRDATPEIARLRAVKDAVQIGFHRKAAAICDELFAVLVPLARDGRSAWRIQVALEALAKDRGAEFCKTWLTVAPAADRCRYWRDENQRVPQPGDQVLLGIMVLLHGHWGHALRTYNMGPPGPPARDVFAVVERMYEGMLARLQPGAPLSAVNEPFEAEFAACMARLGHPPEFRFRSGHALGHSYEDPVGTAEFPQPYDGTPGAASALLIAPGMLFELHPNLFIPGHAGASIGEMVLVQPDGPEVLTRYPRGLIEI